jgi:hypothetical protein
MSELQHYFVSYSTADRRFVEPIVQVLRTATTDVFLDRDSIAPGDKWKDVLTERLETADTLVLFWSHNAEKSKWVTKEWHTAAGAGKRILPVLIDDTPLPEALGDFQWIDFRHLRRRQTLMLRAVIAFATLVVVQFAVYPLAKYYDTIFEARRDLNEESNLRKLSQQYDVPVEASPPQSSNGHSASFVGEFFFTLFIVLLALTGIMLFIRYRHKARTSTEGAAEIHASLNSG